ncbi:MAG TPA: nuclear transport factor 2 family protein [Acidimicrobiales bacterium]|jgi:steroid delta-isomerase|nr:nuclear transport factor 2 family protein [Acidimicrobiales bacterium]
MPTPEALRQLVHRYAEAVTARDLDAIGALFAEDAVQRDPATAPPNVGRAAILAFFQSAVDASTATNFEILDLHTAGSFAAFDFRVIVTLETGTMTIQGIEVFTVGDDGLIGQVDAYWDDDDVTFG